MKGCAAQLYTNYTPTLHCRPSVYGEANLPAKVNLFGKWSTVSENSQPKADFSWKSGQPKSGKVTVKGWCMVSGINYTPCKKLVLSYMSVPVKGLQKKWPYNMRKRVRTRARKLASKFEWPLSGWFQWKMRQHGGLWRKMDRKAENFAVFVIAWETAGRR